MNVIKKVVVINKEKEEEETTEKSYSIYYSNFLEEMGEILSIENKKNNRIYQNFFFFF